MQTRIILLLLFATCLTLHAQQEFREYLTNDSTIHILNQDTSIIATDNELYYYNAAGITPLYDFTNGDETNFIRDFEIISDDVWYTLVGRKNWGSPTTLYKTLDAGQTWVSDTSFYTVAKAAENAGLISEFNDIYQLQRISEDTLILFVSYYQSGLFYSTNGGLNWTIWFANLPANYRGIFECEDDYYLWGIEGDGFPGSMFSFNKALLFSSNENDEWIHWSGVHHPACYDRSPDCIYVPNSLGGYEQFLFFENYIMEHCQDSLSGVLSKIDKVKFNVYPNPSYNGLINIEHSNESMEIYKYKIFNTNKQLVLSNESVPHALIQLDLSQIHSGVYFLVLEYNDAIIIEKLIISNCP